MALSNKGLVRGPLKAEIRVRIPVALRKGEDPVVFFFFFVTLQSLMRKRLIIGLLVALGALVSCGITRDRTDPFYYAGPPDDGSGYVPDGKVEEAWYPCSVKGPTERRMIVYLPPGYEQGDQHYPVVYTLHGARGHETAWIHRGKIFQVTDSVWREGGAGPFILVLPNVNQYQNDKDFENSRYKDALESLFEIDGTVEKGFMNDVVGYVDAHYRTIPDKAHRAICGLSVGALQSMYISADHPDAFGYVGLFSPFWKVIPMPPGCNNDFYFGIKRKWKKQFAPDPPKGYYVFTSDQDYFYLHIQNLRRYFNRHGYPYTYIQTKGTHDWYNWVYYYRYLLEHAFREED